jgi:N-acetylglutamate synthase-like GNAT family acetyltransferase
MARLVEACHDEDLFMYAVAGLEPFYGRFGFAPISEDDLPPTLRARYDWTEGDRGASKITPMRRFAGRYDPPR